MEPTALWNRSRKGDPWKFFDLLILHRGLSDLHSWYSSSQSRALYFGGHHYGEWDGSLYFEEELPELIEPNTGDWNGHISKLLSSPAERMTKHIRNKIRACSTEKEARARANRMRALLNEYSRRLADLVGVPNTEVVTSVISNSFDIIAIRIHIFEGKATGEANVGSRKTVSGNSRRRTAQIGRPFSNDVPQDEIVAYVKKWVEKKTFSHKIGPNEGKLNYSASAIYLLDKYPDSLGLLSKCRLEERIKMALRAIQCPGDMS